MDRLFNPSIGGDVGKNSRMRREAETVEVMIRQYCQTKHEQTRDLCPECNELLLYALKRLKHCPFQERKTTCGNCGVHCYKPGMRDKIRQIMRYVGPRMLLRKPLLSLRHAADGLRKKPLQKKE